MKETSQDIKKKINKSLSYSIKDGSWWAVMAGFGQSYLSAFAVFLNSTPFQLSMLASIPLVLSSFLQLFAFKLTNIFSSRKKLVLYSAFLQALVWLLIIGVSCFTKNVWVLIILSSLYFIFGAIGGPAWNSWMGDLVPEEMRGRYFGMRNRTVGFFSFLMVSIAGILLDKLSQFDTHFAFLTLFFIAFVGRMVSFYYLSKKYEPIVEIRNVKPYGFIKYLKNIRNNNFGMFSLYNSLLYFSVFMVGPLFVIYFLTYLNFTYLQYSVFIAVSAISSFITVSYWGKHADHYGNKAILWVTSNLLFLLPLLWFFVNLIPKPFQFFMGIGINLLSGMAWAGFNISSGNFFYDNVEPELRIRFISYHNVLRGIAIFAGSLIAGWLGSLNFSYGIISNGLLLAMLLSALCRFIVTMIFLNFISEVKMVHKRPRFLHFITVMPVEGLMFDSIVGMNRTLKTFRNKLKNLEKRLNFLEKSFKKKGGALK